MRLKVISDEKAIIAYDFSGQPQCLAYWGEAFTHHSEQLGRNIADLVEQPMWLEGFPGQLVVWEGKCFQGDPDRFHGKFRRLTPGEWQWLKKLSSAANSVEWDERHATAP